MTESTPEMAIDHVAGNIQPLGDLIGRRLMEPVKNERSPAADGQLCNRLFQDGKACLDLQPTIRSSSRGNHQLGLFVRPGKQPRLKLQPSKTVDAEIDGRPAQERLYGALLAQDTGLDCKFHIEVVNDFPRGATRMATAADGSNDVVIMCLDRLIEQFGAVKVIEAASGSSQRCRHFSFQPSQPIAVRVKDRIAPRQFFLRI